MQQFRNRLVNGPPLLGTMLTLDSPDIAELLALIGFDWLFIDGEHGPFDVGSLKSVVQAVGERAKCLVRIPSVQETPIKQALDVGAHGIIAPQIKTAEEAARVVEFARYPPQGSRGIGLARAHGYGTRSAEYLAQANTQLLVVIQAEHRSAVDNIDSILEVEGIDCVLIGPADLSNSYGKLGQLDDPEVAGAIRRIETACKAAQMPLGIFGNDAPSVRTWLQQGFHLVVAGIDTAVFGNAARQLLSEMQSYATSNH